ncbi:MAG TPA: histidine kinase dimerization/phospho-acceptor domain-containing protein [Ktedonobacteraceae bacterium]
MQIGLHLFLPEQEIGWEWLSLYSQEYRLLSRLVQIQSHTASLPDQLAAFTQSLVGAHSPWPIDSCMILSPSEEGPLHVQASAPLDPIPVRMPLEEEPVISTFLEQARQHLLGAEPGSVCLGYGGPLPALDGALRSTGTLWFVPLVCKPQIVGVMRLILREEQVLPLPETGLWQREAFRLMLDLMAATLSHVTYPPSYFPDPLASSREPLAARVAMAAVYGLRTPLTALQLAADHLHDPMASPEERQEDLHLLRKQVTRLNQCVTNLVTLCQLETGPFPLQRIWYRFDLLLAEVTSTLQPHGENRAVHLLLPSVMPRLLLNPKYIGQVLTTLLSQVVRSLPVEAPIELDVQVRNEDVLLLLPAGATTMGQEPSNLVDASTNQDSWWLDFTVSHQLVTAHGGRLWVTSRSERERTICLTLPRRRLHASKQ